MKPCASVVSGTALASLAGAAASVLSAKANPWIPVAGAAASVLSAKANPGFPVDRPNSENLSNVDDTADSGITQVVVNGNYYQRVDKDDTPRSTRGPCTLLGDHVYKVFEDDVEHHGIVVDSFLEKDSWIEIFQVKYDDGQTEDLYPDQFLFLDRPRRKITGNSTAENDNDVEKEAAQDVPGKNVPFLSTLGAHGPNSGNLSNMDDTADSGITQVVVNGNYYQRVDKDDTPRINRGPCTLLGTHVYKVFEDDVEHHGIVVDSALEKDSWIEFFQVKYDDGQTEDLYSDQVLHLDKPRRRFTGNIIADAKKKAAQDAPGEYVPFLSTHEAYDQSVLPYPNPSTGFLPDNPDSGKPWILVGGPNRGKLKNMDDTAVSGSKQGVVVTNYYQSLYKDDTPVEEDSVFSSISDNKIKNIKENLDEGEYVTTINKKRKNKKKKKKKEPKEKKSTVPRKYDQSIEGKQEKDNPVPPTGNFDYDDVTYHHPGNILAAEDVVGKEAVQDAPGKNAPFLFSLTAYYDHLVSSYPYPSSGFPPDNPDSTQKNHQDHYQHYHGHGYKTDTDPKIATDALSFYDRLHVEHNDQNPISEVQESLLGVDDVMKAVVTSPLHNNGHNSNMDSRATTTIGSGSGSGSGDGVTGDVEVDIGMLQTRRSLNSVGNDCNSCASRPKIKVSGSDFKSLVNNCYNIGYACPPVYNGPIGCWNTSEVTDMAYAFDGKGSFNDSINCWNVSNVANMKYMFQDATDFNQPLNDWDVASVTNMNKMFKLATGDFNQPLDDWNVASVTSMKYMFLGASNFNQPLNDWDVASVTTMNKMFYNAENFNQPLDDWDVASVTSMKYMFYGASNFNQPLNDWDVASVTNMNKMFQKATNFNQPLDDWDVASVTSMKQMFFEASNFNQPLDDWNVASVTDMYKMFKYATNFNQPLDDWDVASVTSMKYMFYGASNFNQPLNDWDVASVTDMNKMFQKATDFNQCLSSWADKTPPNIFVNDIFEDSGCQDSDPSAWCCIAPSATPSTVPSDILSTVSSDFPSARPSTLPSDLPSTLPSLTPSTIPSTVPSDLPSVQPSTLLSDLPSVYPSLAPSTIPSIVLSNLPSVQPSTLPSTIPSTLPSDLPSVQTSTLPSDLPSAYPGLAPSTIPSIVLSDLPSVQPSTLPSTIPSTVLSDLPSVPPSTLPSYLPSAYPSLAPSTVPSDLPSVQPSTLPSYLPSAYPSLAPSTIPSTVPSDLPSVQPSTLPSYLPSDTKKTEEKIEKE